VSPCLLYLLPERAALRQARLAAGRLAEHGRAAAAEDDGLGVAEDGGYAETARALDVHEERVGGLDQALELVAPLLKLPRGVEQIDITHGDERHGDDLVSAARKAEAERGPWRDEG